MSKSGQNKKRPAEKSKSEYFSWTDDEVELLLKVTIDYKTAKTIENVDWESCQTKYQDILAKFLERYPSPEEATELGKDYPHSKEEITKTNLTSKIKTVRTKYRKAVDSGRRSGNGRVVLLYFELCEEIWGGSPASNAIASGIETTDIDGLTTVDTEEINSSIDTPSPASSFVLTNSSTEDSLENIESTEEERSDDILPSNVIRERRDLLNSKLADHKKEKLKRKLPNESQLLSCAQEELKMKKQILERMEATDKEHSEYMKKMFHNMEKLTSSIADGFALLRQVMLPQPPYVGRPQQHFQNPSSSYVHDRPVGYSTRVPTTPHNQVDRQYTGQFSYTNALYSDDLNDSDTLQ